LPSPCELIIRAYQSEGSGGSIRAQFSQQHLKEHFKMTLMSKIVLAALSGAMVAAAVAQALEMVLK
jgi:adenine/guanine phosphoribosyltransferase-like PRPP-binding protein